MYTEEEKLRAVQLYIKYDLSTHAVLRELGYPSRNMLPRWYKEYIETGTVNNSNTHHRKYSEEQRQQAVAYYFEHGRNRGKTIQALGYPGKTVLGEWIHAALLERNEEIDCKPGGALVRYTQEQKIQVVAEYCAGKKKPKQILKEYGIPPSTVYTWKREMLRKELEKMPLKTTKPQQSRSIQELKTEKEALQAEVRRLQMEVDVLTTAHEILKKGQGINLKILNNAEKTELIDALRSRYRLNELLVAVSMSKSSYCYQCKARKRGDKYQSLRAAIKEEFSASNKTYGYRRIHCVLKNNGISVSEKVIRRIMSQEGLNIPRFRRRKYSSYMGEISPAVPNLIERNFHAERPNELWLTDITEFHIPAGKVYLSPVIDCFDGLPVSWTIGTSPNAHLANTMLDYAIQTLNWDEHPVVHSDRGCHYRWPGWIERMEKAGLTRSMSKKGCSPDNSACEGFFGRLKNEMFYNRSWVGVTIEGFMDEVNKYLNWYCNKRIKLSLGGLSPIEYRRKLGYII